VAIFLYLYHQLLDHSVDRENEHIKKIKKYILKHIREDVSLDEIASEVHLVPRYVCTLFKRETGMTITEYMVGEKIELAKRLIIMRRQTLTEIAETCGFSDYNYFSRVFKRIVGMTPGEYRKSVSRS
jgi:AraC-like DNA-binding protein